jgi:hypothetical protein
MVHSLASSTVIPAITLQKLREATIADPVLRNVRKHMDAGWPRRNPDGLNAYWSRRDHLLTDDDILFINDRVVVPESMQSEMLQLLHEAHIGAEKMTSAARQVLFWPGMATDIKEIAAACSTCDQHCPANQKEPLIPHAVPERPWMKVGADILTLAGSDFLLVVDYFSKYPELAKLERKNAQCIITHLKSIFARHGIPEVIMSDNMPFSSHEFAVFAEEWGVHQETSNPTYPRSNGQVERAVQTIKRLLLKAQDPYLALLHYRNTPLTGMSHSPAQMLMSRRLRSKVPVAPSHLSPRVVDPRGDLVQQQRKQKAAHDRNAAPLKGFDPGDAVLVRQGKTWRPARVLHHDNAPRSYWVVTDEGSELRRNRGHLRPRKNTPNANVAPGAIPPPTPRPRRNY